jgi:hypothetical protein
VTFLPQYSQVSADILRYLQQASAWHSTFGIHTTRSKAYRMLLYLTRYSRSATVLHVTRASSSSTHTPDIDSPAIPSPLIMSAHFDLHMQVNQRPVCPYHATYIPAPLPPSTLRSTGRVAILSIIGGDVDPDERLYCSCAAVFRTCWSRTSQCCRLPMIWLNVQMDPYAWA